jgi:molecular chaperone GrpE
LAKKEEKKQEENIEQTDQESNEEAKESNEEAKESNEEGEQEVKEPTCEEQLENAKDEIARLEDALLREKAEYENMRKRLEKEKIQAMAYASEQFARDLLAVIDALELASESATNIKSQEDIDNEEVLKKLSEGIELTIEQMRKVYSKHGIELITIENGFDPNYHDAVMQVDSDSHESGEVVQVLQKGYTIKDRVLRPAMVSVAK